MTAPEPRPRAVNVAFWLSLVGAILLIAGGLLGVTTALTTPVSAFGAKFTHEQAHQILVLHGGVGAVFAVAGIALGYLAGRTRNGDNRFRRAQVALSATIVLLTFVLALIAGTSLELLSLIGVVPVAVGATLFTRPAAAAWFAGQNNAELP